MSKMRTWIGIGCFAAVVILPFFDRLDNFIDTLVPPQPGNPLEEVRWMIHLLIGLGLLSGAYKFVSATIDDRIEAAINRHIDADRIERMLQGAEKDRIRVGEKL
jgi:hypothetical protein